MTGTIVAVVPALLPLFHASFRVTTWAWIIGFYAALIYGSFAAWKSEHDRAKSLQIALAEIHADVVLWWLRKKGIQFFTPERLMQDLGLDREDVMQAINRMRDEYKIVSEQPAGDWKFDRESAIRTEYAVLHEFDAGSNAAS